MHVIAGSYERFHDDLEAVGLTNSVLEEIVVRGESLRDSATAYDPPTRGGFDAWAERVRASRELLCPLGWVPEDPENFSLVITPDGRTAVAMATGDAGTGRADQTPRTKRAMGIVAQQVVEEQLDLFQRGDPAAAEPERLIWILLVHRKHGSDVVRAELSLPAIVDDANRVCGWAERVLLDPINLGDPDRRHGSDEDDQGEEVVPQVRPRS